MSKRKQDIPQTPNSLTVTRVEASEKLLTRVSLGRDIKAKQVHSEEVFYTFKSDYNKWDDYNNQLLLNLFTNDDFSQEYNKSTASFIPYTWVDSYKNFLKRIEFKINKLESVINRLELIPEPMLTKSETKDAHLGSQTKKTEEVSVFIGHGRSKLWARVKSFLHDDYNIKAFSFESDSHVGVSIVNVLEEFLEKASFAILILTAEDETAEGKIRARQNVIHEAGLFQGKLGFKKAVLLRQDGLDDFSNVDGLQYIGFTGDNIEQTFYELGRVLKREGIIK